MGSYLSQEPVTAGGSRLDETPSDELGIRANDLGEDGEGVPRAAACWSNTLRPSGSDRFVYERKLHRRSGDWDVAERDRRSQ